MMAENAARSSLRPGEDGLVDCSFKVPSIEPREQLFEVINAAGRRRNHLPSAPFAREI
jgi:hypothetical protein